MAEDSAAKATHLQGQLEEARVQVEVATRSLAETKAESAASHARLLELEVHIQERQDDLVKAREEIAAQRRQIEELRVIAVGGSCA
jgi:phage-related tail protein